MSVTIDPTRLARSIWLDVRRAGDDWLVGNHFVVVDGEYMRCTCPDHTIMGFRCKHLLAVGLREADKDVLMALRQIVREPAQRRKAAAA